MLEVFDWQRADQTDVVRRAVQALSAGQLVAFPAETGYHLTASALAPEAVVELGRRVKEGEGPLMLAVRSPGEALDWAPGMSALARRLARRCWPGPVAFDLREGVGEGLAARLPTAVRDRLCPEGALRLCLPAHEAILHALRLLPGPLAAAALPPNGRGTEALQGGLLIDDGPPRLDLGATVVRCDGDRWSVVRAGAVSDAELARLSPCTVVFLCTGNTCRSPLAEALCKKLLAEHLGCGVEDLPAKGFLVLSAGLSAMRGDPAAAEAIAVAREQGADLSRHCSERMTGELLLQADHLIAMTQSHLRALAPYCTGDIPIPRLLSRNGADVADPIGGDEEVYRGCAQQIIAYLRDLLPELLERG